MKKKFTKQERELICKSIKNVTNDKLKGADDETLKLWCLESTGKSFGQVLLNVCTCHNCKTIYSGAIHKKGCPNCSCKLKENGFTKR